MKVISVFGSSAPQSGSPDYEQARLVGRLLAEAGCAVATGGYGGIMTAVSHGASETGGHVIGVGSQRIEQYRQDGMNPYVTETVMFGNLTDRLLHLVRHNDGIIALPGGIGTISEVALTWSLLQVGEIDPRPFALIGSLWQTTIETFANPMYVREKDMRLLAFSSSPESAVAHVTRPH
ncbi:MAG: LOG family protein [Chloroflexi bacterium]|nr:LOG family protein [Chloroflexota bacterium]